MTLNARCVRRLLGSRLGEIRKVTRLDGIKESGGCFQVDCAGGTVCAKMCTNAQAVNYAALAAGRRCLPQLYDSIPTGDGTLLVTEYIPNPYPKERWATDRAAVKILADLHSHARVDRFAFEYAPCWHPSMTGQLLGFATPAGISLPADRLRRYEQLSQALFAPVCLLHGDPNPTNWRLREDGELVLLDWERLCLGHPAIDLAILLPGTGSADGRQETFLAQTYIDCGGVLYGSEPLPLLIRTAKIWSVVEFLCNARNNLSPSAAQRLLENLRDSLR